ncbi:hypothetical protein D8B26_004782 [Coccidioides posadasii str. Silveira]|uniref:uncharacterized protein n=1 Tax=Coccidioides posadasii (strain RMSCC 757 / Silveira) TaxID=443226 RepID=UPI001BEE0836|nr:hypothetical protein D8B26_004782 [Coccidioides posadasii str. Silveira]
MKRQEKQSQVRSTRDRRCISGVLGSWHVSGKQRESPSYIIIIIIIILLPACDEPHVAEASMLSQSDSTKHAIFSLFPFFFFFLLRQTGTLSLAPHVARQARKKRPEMWRGRYICGETVSTG